MAEEQSEARSEHSERDENRDSNSELSKDADLETRVSEETSRSTNEVSNYQGPKSEYKPKGKPDLKSRQSKLSKYAKNITAASLAALNSIDSESQNNNQDYKPKSEYRITSKSKANSGKKEERTIHGAVGIIYHETDDGQILFLLEENSSDYAVKEYQGLIRTIGGAVNTDDKSFKDAFMREVSEEFQSEKAKDAIIETVLQNPKVYCERSYDIEGQIAKSVYFDVKLDKKAWEAASSSRNSHDAGPFRIYTIDEILTMPHDRFAFEEGNILHPFAWALKHGHSGSGHSGHHKTLESKIGLSPGSPLTPSNYTVNYNPSIPSQLRYAA